MPDLLACRPILRSQDIEETRAFLSARSVEIEPLGDSRDRDGFDVRYNGVYLQRMWLGYIRYGAPVRTRLSPVRGDYWIHFPMDGRVAVTSGRTALDLDPARAAVTSPLDFCGVRTDSSSARLCLSVHGDALRLHLADLLDDAPARPLRFAPTIDLGAGFGQGFFRLMRTLALDYCESGTLSHPLVANDFEQFVLSSLLLSVRHNYADALQKRKQRVAPRDVRRAVEYIHAHASEPIALGDLARASGVAGRTLLQHFHNVHGQSPIRYLRNHRLRRVREEILEGKAPSVSAAALRWGFSHFGRFASAYRARFGESPSATLARARR
jgi:AraC-like DNA-binding protein